MQITNIKCILTAPGNIGLAVVKIKTSEAGLYGVGCATFTQRLLPVRSAVEDYLKPLLIGRDPQRIEDIWQLCYQNSDRRNSPVLNKALSGVDQALWDIKGKLANMPLTNSWVARCARRRPSIAMPMAAIRRRCWTKFCA